MPVMPYQTRIIRTVTCFWHHIDRNFEQLERAVLLEYDSIEVSLEFKYWINELRENTRWRELSRLANPNDSIEEI